MFWEILYFVSAAEIFPPSQIRHTKCDERNPAAFALLSVPRSLRDHAGPRCIF